MQIKFDGIKKYYGEKRALGCASGVIKSGQPVCISAPSGGGKTTFLSILMGLQKPGAGSIEIPAGMRASAVFQEDRLCEGQSALRNVALVQKNGNKPAATQEIKNALTELGIPEEDQVKPVRFLSGGQRRRVALARAMLASGDAVFLDEPFTGLDEVAKTAAINFILKKLKGRILVVATHAQSDAAALGAATLIL